MESTDLNKLITLIALIESEPAIWKDYTKTEAEREKIWSSIAKQLGISVREAKLTFRQLRDKYWKEKGEKEASTEERKEWALFKSLAFLDAGIKRRRGSINHSRPKMYKVGDYANSETEPESSDNSDDIDLRRTRLDSEALGIQLVKAAIQLNASEQSTANVAFGKFLGKTLDELGPPFDTQLQSKFMELIIEYRNRKLASVDNKKAE